MLNRYVRLVFDDNVEPKVINNRALTGKSLQNFFIVYCKMFQSGGSTFPKVSGRDGRWEWWLLGLCNNVYIYLDVDSTSAFPTTL